MPEKILSQKALLHSLVELEKAATKNNDTQFLHAYTLLKNEIVVLSKKLLSTSETLPPEIISTGNILLERIALLLNPPKASPKKNSLGSVKPSPKIQIPHQEERDLEEILLPEIIFPDGEEDVFQQGKQRVSTVNALFEKRIHTSRADEYQEALTLVCNHPILTPDEENIYFTEYADLNNKNSDPSRLEELKSLLVTHNQRLVVSIAKRFTSSTFSLMDLVQEGNIGLLTAIKKFDPSRGYKFSTYGTFWIKQSIRRSIADKDRIVRIPTHAIELYEKIQRAAQIVAAEQKPLNVTNIVEVLNRDTSKKKISIAQVSQIISFVRQTMTGTLVSINDEGQVSDMDFPSPEDTPEDLVVQKITREEMETYLHLLPPRHREVLELTYGFQEMDEKISLAKIGARLGVTRERIRQMQLEGLKKLRLIMNKVT